MNEQKNALAVYQDARRLFLDIGNFVGSVYVTDEMSPATIYFDYEDYDESDLFNLFKSLFTKMGMSHVVCLKTGHHVFHLDSEYEVCRLVVVEGDKETDKDSYITIKPAKFSTNTLEQYFSQAYELQ